MEVSCKPMGTISSARKHVFQKKCCKNVAKTVARKVPSPETRINTGFFGISKPKGTTPTRRGLNNSVYVILLFVSLSILILRFICIILCKNALVIILLSWLITRIISPWIIWKWYADIIAYNRPFCNSKF